MTGDKRPGATPATLRSGTPEALAALSHSRGAAVFAYCQHAVGRDDAVEAAAEAFAQLRIAILAPGSLTSKAQAEQLLRSVTRRTVLAHLVRAADLDARPGTAGCAGRESELLGYIEQTLTPADRTTFAAHLEQCHPCTEVLQRLEDAEDAFDVKPGTKVPRFVAREIVTALATAAPVSSHDGDAIAVRNEALLLLPDEDGATATDPSPAPSAEKDPDANRPVANERLAAPQGELPPPPSPPLAPRTPPRPAPARHEPSPAVRKPDLIDRLRAWSGREGHGPDRMRRLLRAAARLAVVVGAAGAAGTLLGVGIAALTGGDDSPSSAPVAPTASTPAAAADTVRVDVASTTVRSATIDAVDGARVRVRARVENASDRVIRPEPPRLLVDNIRVAPEPTSAGSAPALLAQQLDAGAAAEGALRFDLQSRTASELAAGRVRLRIAGKIVELQPVLREPGAAG